MEAPEWEGNHSAVLPPWSSPFPEHEQRLATPKRSQNLLVPSSSSSFRKEVPPRFHARIPVP